MFFNSALVTTLQLTQESRLTRYTVKAVRKDLMVCNIKNISKDNYQLVFSQIPAIPLPTIS